MAKSIRYPKKLRVKLERIAAEREAREKAPATPNGFDPFKTFLHSFMPCKSAHLLHARFDDLLYRIEQTWHLEAPVNPEIIIVPPPWEGKFKPGASK